MPILTDEAMTAAGSGASLASSLASRPPSGNDLSALDSIGSAANADGVYVGIVSLDVPLHLHGCMFLNGLSDHCRI